MINTKTSRLLEILSSKGGDFSDIYSENEDFFSVVVENSKIKSLKTGQDQGLFFRTVKGDKTFGAYTNSEAYTNLQAIAANIAESVNDKSSIKKTIIIDDFVHADINVSSREQEVIEKFIQESQKINQVSSLINQVTLSYSQVLKSVIIANTDGLVYPDTRIYHRYTVQVVAKDGSITQSAYEGPGITGEGDIFKLYPIEQTSEKVVERVLKMLKAEEAPVGKMPVVMMGEAGGTMIHEACGHALEADFIYKDTSVFNKLLNKQVASPEVTVIDDGSIPGLYGSFTYDDEGIAPTKTVLIEKGVLKGFITDKMNSKLLGIPLTGNGRRESFRSKPIPRMSNTYIANGKMRADEIVSSVEEGLLVKRMGGGQVNITNGDFLFEVTEGYLIKNGKVSKPVRGASLIGNGPDALKKIEMVGNDKEFMPGVCGKYDHVPVSDAQPTMKISEIVIGGK